MKNIMLVSSEAYLIRVMRLALEGAGHTVCAMPTGGDALQVMTSISPDLVIADAQLRDMSGTEFCRSLVGRSDAPGVLLLSEWSTPQQQLDRLGVVQEIEKPLSVSRLLGSIERHFGDRLSDRESQEAWTVVS